MQPSIGCQLAAGVSKDSESVEPMAWIMGFAHLLPGDARRGVVVVVCWGSIRDRTRDPQREDGDQKSAPTSRDQSRRSNKGKREKEKVPYGVSRERREEEQKMRR